MERAFTGLTDLRTEIDLLKIKRFQQEEVLKDKLSDPSAILNTFTTHFKSKKPTSNKSLMQGLLSHDIVSNLARIIFPIALNGTLFKKSNFIIKALVTFASQKAATKFNTNAISGVTDKIMGWFAHKQQQRQERKVAVDYGIPPDSETF
jgi:hypothetical protein